MGTSYDGLLVAGPRGPVVAALAAERVIAVVAEAGPDRTVVIPAEDQFSGAGCFDIAAWLSHTGAPVLAHAVSDSDLLVLSVYEHGTHTHSYVSERAHPGSPVEIEDAGIDGVGYEISRGPAGADPRPFLPFGVGPVDVGELERLLNAAPEYVFAERLHADLVVALNLDPAPLTTAFRILERLDRELADAIWVPEHYRPVP